MAIWLIRAGKYGEHEDRFLNDNRICLTWAGLQAVDLTVAKDYDELRALIEVNYQGESPRKIGNWSGQIWAFTLAMKEKDWIVMPKKGKGTIALAEIQSIYKYDPNADIDYRHYREVRWLNQDVPRGAFDQDLLYSMGAFLTVCEIKRNNAEARIRAMFKNGFDNPIANIPISQSPPTTGKQAQNEAVDEVEETGNFDIEQYTRDLIAKFIIQKFKGHGLARLVDAVLKAQGYSTYLSPEGPDKGIDILAAKGSLGFESPKICVQVKSGDVPSDRPELTQLIGAIQNSQAEKGLFVSWSGFKSSVYREVPSQFFKVRLWDANDLIEQILENYENLDQTIKSELPLKRIWTLVDGEE
jgi:restriction system protein